MNIWILKNGKQSGPYTKDQVENYLKLNAFSDEDLAFAEGDVDWVYLRRLRDRFLAIDFKSPFIFYSDAQSQKRGPYSYEELLPMVCPGGISQNTYVLLDGADQWITYGEYLNNRIIIKNSLYDLSQAGADYCDVFVGTKDSYESIHHFLEVVTLGRQVNQMILEKEPKGIGYIMWETLLKMGGKDGLGGKIDLHTETLKIRLEKKRGNISTLSRFKIYLKTTAIWAVALLVFIVFYNMSDSMYKKYEILAAVISFIIGLIYFLKQLYNLKAKKRKSNIIGRLVIVTPDHLIAINRITCNEDKRIVFDYGLVCGKDRATFEFSWLNRRKLELIIKTEKEEYYETSWTGFSTGEKQIRATKGKWLTEATVELKMPDKVDAKDIELWGDALLAKNQVREIFKK